MPALAAFVTPPGQPPSLVPTADELASIAADALEEREPEALSDAVAAAALSAVRALRARGNAAYAANQLDDAQQAYEQARAGAPAHVRVSS